MSLKEGIFPSLNKEAYVCPIFKKNDKLKCENYRPISLLSNISKMFERVMYNRIEEFLTSSNILKKFSTNHVHTHVHAPGMHMYTHVHAPGMHMYTHVHAPGMHMYTHVHAPGMQDYKREFMLYKNKYEIDD